MYLTLVLSVIFVLAGCGTKAEKMCRIEILNADLTNAVTLEQQSQKDVTEFFDEESWEACEDVDEPEITNIQYQIELYQEKTQTLIPDKDEDMFEKIAEYTTYCNSDMVKVVISENVIKSGLISEGNMTFYYKGSETFFDSLHKAVLEK